MQDDLRDATRMLRSQPGFAAVALLMLALGIGATTAIFTVVNAVLINPLPYPDSDALVSIVHTVDGRDEPFFGDAIYNTYRENTRAFEDFGVWTPYANVATVRRACATATVRVARHPTYQTVSRLAVSNSV